MYSAGYSNLSAEIGATIVVVNATPPPGDTADAVDGKIGSRGMPSARMPAAISGGIRASGMNGPVVKFAFLSDRTGTPA
jgi:hypothetical protein